MSIKNPLLLPSVPDLLIEPNKSSVDRKPKLATPGMDSLREKLFAEGLSEESAILIANGRGPGTVSHYESARRKWNSYCVRRKIHPIRCSMMRCNF